MKIAFIGLGIMGRPMALNLLKGGHQVTVWARRAESMQALLDVGAIGASSPTEAARGNELVISMVADAPDVAEVMRGVAKGRPVRDARAPSASPRSRLSPCAEVGNSHPLSFAGLRAPFPNGGLFRSIKSCKL